VTRKESNGFTYSETVATMWFLKADRSAVVFREDMMLSNGFSKAIM